MKLFSIISNIDRDVSHHEAWIGTTIANYVRSANQFGYRFMVSFWAWETVKRHSIIFRDCFGRL